VALKKAAEDIASGSAKYEDLSAQLYAAQQESFAQEMSNALTEQSLFDETRHLVGVLGDKEGQFNLALIMFAPALICAGLL